MQLEASKTIKGRRANPPILRLPKADLLFSIDTDASEYQLGCAFVHTYDDTARHAVGHWSRTLNSAARNYSASEKECLAIVWAMKALIPYLKSKLLTVFSDHQALKWLLSLNETEAQGRLDRWRLRMSEIDFKVVCKKGVQSSIADAFSLL